jgi:hypothetical protein
LKKSIGSSKIVVDKTNNGGENPILYFDDIKVEFESQEFKGTHMEISPNKDKSVLFLESVRSMQTVRCPYCGGSDGQNGFRRRKK